MLESTALLSMSKGGCRSGKEDICDGINKHIIRPCHHGARSDRDIVVNDVNIAALTRAEL